MKALARLLLVIWVAVFAVPVEQWKQLTKEGKEQELKVIQRLMEESLGCTQIRMTVRFDEHHLYFYGECENKKYMAQIGGVQ